MLPSSQTATFLPTKFLSASSPTWTTVPAPSKPGVVGRVRYTGNLPIVNPKSDGLIGAALIFTSICFGPSAGGTTSVANLRGYPYCKSWAARPL